MEELWGEGIAFDGAGGELEGGGDECAAMVVMGIGGGDPWGGGGGDEWDVGGAGAAGEGGAGDAGVVDGAEWSAEGGGGASGFGGAAGKVRGGGVGRIGWGMGIRPSGLLEAAVEFRYGGIAWSGG